MISIYIYIYCEYIFNSIKDYWYSAFYDTIVAKQSSFTGNEDSTIYVYIVEIKYIKFLQYMYIL